MIATVAGYYRVSVARDGMQAPQIYEEQIRSYCRYKNLQLARIYKDIDMSGWRDSPRRPGLEKLKVDRTTYTTIVVPKLARFGRSVRDLVELFALFDRDAIALAFLDMNIDTGTSQGRLLRHIMAAFAEYESDVKSDYAKANYRHLASLGRPGGGMGPFGYKRDPETKSYAVDPPRAEIVRAIFRWYSTGKTQYEIMTLLNEQQRFRRKERRWNVKFIGRVLDNPAYVARMVVDGKLLEGNWVPLIDIETWDTVQDRRRNSIHVHRQRRLARKGPYLLSGLLVCGTCGGSKLWHRSRANTVDGVYLCSLNAKHPGSCSGGAISTARADAIVERAYLDRCRIQIIRRAQGDLDEVIERWEDAMLSEKRKLLALAMDRVVLMPHDGPPPYHGNNVRQLDIVWRVSLEDHPLVTDVVADIAVSLHRPGRLTPADSQAEQFRQYEVDVERHTREADQAARSERAKAGWARWRAQQVAMKRPAGPSSPTKGQRRFPK
jgi:DNA invertase Pin-like site-specific DNA recombinase